MLDQNEVYDTKDEIRDNGPFDHASAGSPDVNDCNEEVESLTKEEKEVVHQLTVHVSAVRSSAARLHSKYDGGTTRYLPNSKG